MERTVYLPAVSKGRPVVMRLPPPALPLNGRYETTFHEEETSLNVPSTRLTTAA